MSGQQHKKIILDTDLCGDCDDVGAMAVLLNLDRFGNAVLRPSGEAVEATGGSFQPREKHEYQHS